MREHKKTTVKLVLLYLILTVGMWMFFYSYANSYNKLTDKKIVPAAFSVNERGGELEVIGRKYILDLHALAPESKLYFAAYLLLPAELRRGMAFLETENCLMY